MTRVADLENSRVRPEQSAPASPSSGVPLRSDDTPRPGSRGTRALLTAEGCAAAGAVGTRAQPGAWCSAVGSAVSLRSRRPPARPPSRVGAQGRSAQPRPRRRLEARPAARDGARGAPCWEPLGTARG